MNIREITEAKIQILSEKKNKDGSLYVFAPWIMTGRRNRNGRLYSQPIIQREIAKFQDRIKSGSIIGSADHPAGAFTTLSDASHIITKLSLDKNGQGWAEMRILPTSKGKNVIEIIKAGGQLGISARGAGTVSPNGIVGDDYKLLGIDIVTNPSEPTATFDKSNIFESVEFNEEKNMKNMMGLTENYVNELMQSVYEIYIEEGTFKGSFAEFEKENGNAVRASILVEEGKCGDIEEALKYLGAKEEIVPIAPIKRVTPAEIFLEATVAGIDPALYAKKMNANLDRQEESDSVLNMGKIIYILSEARQAGFDTSDEQEKKRLLGAIRKQETRKVLTEDERAEIVARKTGSTKEFVLETWATERKKKEKEQKRIGKISLVNSERMAAGFGTEIRPECRKISQKILDKE